MKNFVLFSVVLVSLAAPAKEKSRPMSEMHGDCSAYKMDLKDEFAVWDQKSVAIKAKSADALPWTKKLDLLLAPQDQVTFVHAPEKSFPVKGGAHAGVFALEVPKSGKVRVAAGSKVWFDVVDRETKRPVAATEFEMQTGCDKIFKVVTFELLAKKSYVLQVSSSTDPQASFLISAE